MPPIHGSIPMRIMKTIMMCRAKIGDGTVFDERFGEQPFIRIEFYQASSGEWRLLHPKHLSATQAAKIIAATLS